MAARGYSRDNRSDCKQACTRLVVTQEGLPATLQTVVPSKPGNPAVTLDGMGKTELENLLAAVSQRFKDAGQGA